MDKIKVLLVNPPQLNLVTNNIPSIVDEERGYNPPLGILYVAAYARENTRHEIRVIDAVVEELDYPALKRRIARESPDVVGITATTFTLVDAYETAKLVKEIDGDNRVVMGGPHPYIYPDETINLPGVDFLVLGEGEKAFSALLDNLRQSRRAQEDKRAGIPGQGRDSQYREPAARGGPGQPSVPGQGPDALYRDITPLSPGPSPSPP